MWTHAHAGGSERLLRQLTMCAHCLAISQSPSYIYTVLPQGDEMKAAFTKLLEEIARLSAAVEGGDKGAE
jgi:hypothetical protein